MKKMVTVFQAARNMDFYQPKKYSPRKSDASKKALVFKVEVAKLGSAPACAMDALGEIFHPHLAPLSQVKGAQQYNEVL